MAGKELTFKLVMEADTKNYVSNIKDSESVTKALYAAIKQESEKLKAASEQAAQEVGKIVPDDLQKKADQAKGKLSEVSQAAGELGNQANQAAAKVDGLENDLSAVANEAKQAGAILNTAIPEEIIPSESTQKVSQLVTGLHSTTQALGEMGSDANISADNLKQLGDYGQQALAGLQNDLQQAKLHLNYLAATNATPEDIERAKAEVKNLETGVKQVKTAFDGFQGVANGALSSVATQAEVTEEAITDVVPSELIQKAQSLSEKFFSAAKEIEALGDKSVISAGELRSMASIGEQGLDELNSALKAAQAELVRLQNTDGTLKDIEIAKDRVLSIEDAIKETSSAFNYYQDVAVNAMRGVDNATQSTINQLQQFSAVDLSGVIGEAQTVTRAIESMGSGATVSTREVQRIGELGSNAINALERELNEAKLAWQALSSASHDISLEELNQAKQKVERLEQALDLTENSMNEFKSATQQAVPVVDHLDQSLEKTNHELKDTETFGQRAASEVEGLRNSFNALTGVLAAVGIGTSAMEIAQVSDQYKTLSGRIQIAIGDNANLKQAMDDVANVAIKTNSNLVATGDLFARLTKIGQEMKWPQEQALALTETINRAIQVGGGSAEANEAAITQLNQALGSGVLRGDEFNSMVEQSPRLTQAMADGLGVTTGQLRNMAEQGQLTTAVVTKAILSQSEVITAEFNKFPATIGASIENLKTAWTIYIGEADAASGASAKVAEALKFVSQNLDALITTLTAAAQAFIAYKAIGMAGILLEKANAAKAAQVEIAAETLALSANTGANTANERATRLTALAKTELAAATAASATANTGAVGVFGKVTGAANGLKAGLVSVISRFGAYGAAAAGVIVIGDLLISNFQKLDDWLVRQGSNFFDWAIARATGTKSLAEQERDLAAAEEESRKKQEASAAAKEKHAAKVEMLKNASLGLNEVSKATVAEFDEQITAGKAVAEALDGVAKSFNFDSTTGINNGITALLALQTQGKATGEEIRKSLTGILKDEDLGAFQGRLAAIPVNIDKQLVEVNAKIKARQAELDEWKKANQNASMNDWLAATEKYRDDIQKLQAEASALNVQYANSVKGAALVQGAILDEAIRRTGLSYEELSGKSTKAFTSAKNDVNILIQNLDQLKSKGVDVGQALDVSISKAINTATNQRELDDLKVKINDLRTILSSKVADGLLRQAEQQLVDLKEKADLARAGINSVEEAFGLFGMKTPAQLKTVAEEYKAAFDVMRNSGQATLAQQQEAFKQYAEKAIAANKGVADSTILSQASMLDMKIEVDATGKATVSAIKPLENALDRVKDGFDGIRGGARSAGQAMREEAKSSTEAWSEALTAMQGKLKASKTGVMAKNGYSVDEIEQQLTEMGYSGNARQKAKELFETAQQGPGGYYRSASHEYAARYGVSAYDNQKQTGNYMFIAEQLEKLEEYAGKSGSVGAGSKAKTVVPEVNINSLAPDVSYPKTSLPVSDPARIVRYEFDLGNGKTATMYGSPNDGDELESMLRKLEMIKKSS